MFHRPLLLCASLLLANIAAAEEPGFGDVETPGDFEVATGEQTRDKKHWRLTAAYNLGTSLESPQSINAHRGELRVQWEKLLKQKYFVELDAKLIARFDSDQALPPGETVNGDARLRSLYVQTSNARWSSKLGYQVVTLGKMDMVPVVDVLSPWDYSEFAFTAPEDARVSQPAWRVSRHQNRGTMEFIWTPVPAANRYPGSGAPGLLESYLGTSNFDLVIDEPYEGGEGEAAFRWARSSERHDISFTLASVLQDNPMIEPVDLLAPTPLYRVSYPRYQLAGLGINIPRGDFLWKLEAAYLNQVSFFDTEQRKLDGVQFAGGFEYLGPSQLSIGIELGHLQFRPPAGSSIPAESSQVGMRISKNFLNDTLGAVLYLGYQWQDRYLTQSGSLKYSINDQVSLEMVATVFSVGNSSSMYAFTDNWDQLAFRLTYSR